MVFTYTIISTAVFEVFKKFETFLLGQKTTPMICDITLLLEIYYTNLVTFNGETLKFTRSVIKRELPCTFLRSALVSLE